MVLTFLFWKRGRIRLIRRKESHKSWVAYQLSQNPNFKCPFVKVLRQFIKIVRIALVICFVNYLRFLPEEIFTFLISFQVSCTDVNSYFSKNLMSKQYIYIAYLQKKSSKNGVTPSNHLLYFCQYKTCRTETLNLHNHLVIG